MAGLPIGSILKQLALKDVARDNPEILEGLQGGAKAGATLRDPFNPSGLDEPHMARFGRMGFGGAPKPRNRLAGLTGELDSEAEDRNRRLEGAGVGHKPNSYEGDGPIRGHLGTDGGGSEGFADPIDLISPGFKDPVDLLGDVNLDEDVQEEIKKELELDAQKDEEAAPVAAPVAAPPSRYDPKDYAAAMNRMTQSQKNPQQGISGYGAAGRDGERQPWNPSTGLSPEDRYLLGYTARKPDFGKYAEGGAWDASQAGG